MYLAPSRTWHVPELSQAEVDAFLTAQRTSGIATVVAHASLLLNLASANDGVRDHSIAHLKTEMRRANLFGVDRIVVHPGSHEHPSTGINRIVSALDEVVHAIPNVRVLLETVAGQGNAIGATFEELAEIVDGCAQPDRFGICIDTCHVFAAGYDVRLYSGLANTLDQCSRTIGLDRIGCFHFNDSKGILGSRVDRHMPMIGQGQIGTAAFHALLRDERFVGVPIIIEPPDGENTTRANLDLLKSLRDREAPVEEQLTTLF
jgi:deoxyribonuclease-4